MINTNKVSEADFRIQYFTIGELLDRFRRFREEQEQLNFFVERNSGRQWSLNKQSLFIESILCGIPVASLYIDGSNPIWNVIDGVERLNAINKFVNNRLKLSEIELLSKDYSDLCFMDLPVYIQRRFLNTPLMVYILTTILPREVKNIIFERLNS